jgi:uncharacterized membrane protein YbhN (UPF0104 family)
VPKLNRQVTTAVAGLTALLVGSGLYVVFIGIALNYYDERSRPWWLVSLWFLALALAMGGLIAVLLCGPRRAPSTSNAPPTPSRRVTFPHAGPRGSGLTSAPLWAVAPTA